MNARQRESLFIGTGETHPELAAGIAECMGLELGPIELRTHPNTEQYIRYEESVREKHVILIQPHAPVNGKSVADSLHQHLEMIFAARLASAAQITAVPINLAGARQDRKARGRESPSVALNLRAMQLAGASRIVTVDLHSPQSQLIFDGPFDHLTAQPLLRKAVKRHMKGAPEDYVMVSPDTGHSKASELHARALGIGLINMTKIRDPKDPTTIIRPDKDTGIEEVDGRTCIIIDDLLDTAGTLVSAAEVLHSSGAKRILTAATHGWFSPPALERIEDSPIDKIIVSDSLPSAQAAHAELADRIEIVQLKGMIGSALTRIVEGSSVSEIFNNENYS